MNRTATYGEEDFGFLRDGTSWSRILACMVSWSIACLILASAPLHAQATKTRRDFYSIQDGLSNYWVNCLFQDRQGFLWIGTQSGLNRYDGYTFKQYLYHSDTDESNGRNCVWAIAEDEEGNIWTGTVYGLDRRDKKTDSVIHFQHIPGNTRSLSANSITSLAMDTSGNLWIGTGSDGLNILNTRRLNACIARGERPSPDFKVIRRVPGRTDGLSSNGIRSVSRDEAGRIWIFTGVGVDAFDPRKNVWRHLATGSTQAVGTVYDDGRGSIWIAQGGLHHVDAATWRMQTVFNSAITAVIPDGKGGMLLAGTDVVYHRSTDIHSNQLDEYDRGAQQMQTSITACLQDRTGTLWLGTERGLLKRDDMPAWFSVLKASPPERNRDFQVTSFSEGDDGSILVGTISHGIYRMHPTDTSIHMKSPRGAMSRLQRAENNIYSIRNGPDQRYAIGSGAGFYVLSADLTRKDRIGYRAGDRVPKLGYVFATCVDDRGNLWFSVAGRRQPRLLRYDPRSRSIDSNGILQQRVNAICGEYIWVMHQDRRRRFWLGMDNGLCLFDPSDSSLQYFTHARGNGNSLSSDKIRSILEDSRGKMYIGTWGGGMNVYDERTRTFSRYTKSNGLAENTVSGMLEDSRGDIWIATNSGLSRFNPNTRKIANYYNDEIQSIGVLHSHAYGKTRDGRFLIGGNGVLSFYPDSIRDDSAFAPLMVTSFSVFGKEIRSEVAHGEEISIPWKSNYFRIEYAALEFREPEKIQYAYRLDGVHPEWVHTGTQRSCSFTNLPPGEYVLRIKSTNSIGAWNRKAFFMKIRIVPPLHMTSWFKWTTGVIGFLCLVLLWELRMKHVRNKEKEKRYLIEAELKALRLQMNPHFIFNSLNAIQDFLFANSEEEANNYLTKFARLMRMILEHSRHRTIAVSEELEALRLYLELEALLFENRFTYDFRIDRSVDTTRQMPAMLIQPYIENAIRHGILHKEEQGRIIMEMRQTGDALFCSIEDNGIGRERARRMKDHSGRKESIGMSVTEERLNILNRLNKRPLLMRVIDLKDDAGEPSGTRIEISIPIE